MTALAPARSPVGCTRPQPTAAVRLVAFGHAGGGPSTYRAWAQGLAPLVELWDVELPGRGGRRSEPFAREWGPLVDDLAAAIARDVPAPFALFGHSLGALLAFEVARRLSPVHLFVAGRGDPALTPALDVPETDAGLLGMIDRLYGGVPEAVRAAPDVLAYFLPVLRADLELARAYALRPAPALSCPITAMTGAADPVAPPAALTGWRRRTAAGCEVRVLAGGHFFLVDERPAVLATIVDRLTGSLQRRALGVGAQLDVAAGDRLAELH